MTDSLRRAGCDHVACGQRGEVGAEGDDLRHGMDQEISGRFLYLLSVEPRD
jgi:hypothetical protein